VRRCPGIARKGKAQMKSFSRHGRGQGRGSRSLLRGGCRIALGLLSGLGAWWWTLTVLAAPPPGQPAPPTAPAVPPSGSVTPVGYSTSPPGGGTSSFAPVPSGTAPASHPLDVPLQLIHESSKTFQNVRDYSCTFIKQEQLHGQLQPENVVQMRVRTQPFSFYLRWQAPQSLAGQEVAYVTGRYNNALRVHATGLRGAVGFVTLDPNDVRVRQQSRHPVQNAGLGNLIELLRRSWETDRTREQPQVRVADFEFAHRKCTRVEIVRPNRVNGQTYAYRTLTYFDKETHLPIRIESYDWPRQGGPAEGVLLECYSFIDMRFNLGLGDDAFVR
jgi:hypothetical protein